MAQRTRPSVGANARSVGRRLRGRVLVGERGERRLLSTTATPTRTDAGVTCVARPIASTDSISERGLVSQSDARSAVSVRRRHGFYGTAVYPYPSPYDAQPAPSKRELAQLRKLMDEAKQALGEWAYRATTRPRIW